MSITNKDKSVIPKGDYCYDVISGFTQPNPDALPFFRTKLCPYWSLVKENGEETGHCSYLNISDNITLWDQVKECGENVDD